MGGAHKLAAPFFAYVAKGGNHERMQQGFDHAAGARNQMVSQPSLTAPFIQEVETVTAPAPFFRRFDQFALDQSAMHVHEFLDALLRRPPSQIYFSLLLTSPSRNC